MDPKAKGSWNLHLAAPKDLDFFIATGSTGGVFGTPGQANYAAGNTYLAAMIQYRRSVGLAGSILHVGAVEDVGYVAQNSAAAASLRAAGGYFLRTPQLLAGLEWAIASSLPEHSDHQLAIGLRSDKLLSDPANRVLWKKDARMQIYHNQNATSDTKADTNETGALHQFITSIKANPDELATPKALEIVTREIGNRVYIFMLRPVEEMDTSASLVSLGVDSLVTIEIRNWIKRNFCDIELSTLQILNAATIEGLGKLIVGSLKACSQPTGGNTKSEE